VPELMERTLSRGPDGMIQMRHVSADPLASRCE
jgi:hypothetical protein